MQGLKRTIVALTILTSACGNLARAPPPDSQSTSGQTRIYYIAADELDWDYAPSGTDQITGDRYHFGDVPDSRGMLDPNNSIYRKALFREYTDATFASLKPRSEAWAHLGL